MKICKATAVVGLVALAIPQSPKAAFLSIDDTSKDEVIIVSANDFEGGLTVNGSLLQEGLDDPATKTYDETANGISFSGSWLTGGNVEGGQIVVFLEPGPAGALVVSDILRFTVDNDGPFSFINGTFISDPDGGPGLALPTEPDVIRWNESDGPYRFDLPFLTALANSDTDDVPDSGPGLLGLVTLAAFAGFGASRNICKKAA